MSTTAPLPPAAEAALHRLELAFAPSVDRLVAAVGAWASRSHRQNSTLEGFRLLNVLRIHARPIHNLRALDNEADRLKRLVNKGDPAGWAASYTAHIVAEETANDAYAAAMRDVYDVFEVLTGVSADSTQGLSLKVSVSELAASARELTAATA